MTDTPKPSLSSISAEVRSYVFDLEQKVEKAWQNYEVLIVAIASFMLGAVAGQVTTPVWTILG